MWCVERCWVLMLKIQGNFFPTLCAFPYHTSVQTETLSLLNFELFLCYFPTCAAAVPLATEFACGKQSLTAQKWKVSLHSGIPPRGAGTEDTCERNTDLPATENFSSARKSSRYKTDFRFYFLFFGMPSSWTLESPLFHSCSISMLTSARLSHLIAFQLSVVIWFLIDIVKITLNSRALQAVEDELLPNRRAADMRKLQIVALESITLLNIEDDSNNILKIQGFSRVRECSESILILICEYNVVVEPHRSRKIPHIRDKLIYIFKIFPMSSSSWLSEWLFPFFSISKL